MNVRENLETVRNAIQKIARREILVIGVSKKQSLEKIEEAVSAGLSAIGNNYAQEGEPLLQRKWPGPVEWHFIGHIQTRKVKYLTAYDWVQSLDRLEVAEKLNERLKAEGKTISVLVEVNIGREPQKSGVMPEDLPSFLLKLAPFTCLKLRGFMAMPPFLEPIEDRRPFFQEMKQIFQRFQSVHSLDTLSMGTSDDYLLAIEEGATMVRLGTLLFGARK